MPYRLGKHPPVTDPRTLHFAKYLTPGVPAPPVSIDYGAKVGNWPMYFNDQYGDCTCAAAAHMIQNWTANASKEVTPPPEVVLGFYEHFVGTPPPPDDGLDMLSVLKYWRQTGLDSHKIEAFAAVKLGSMAEAQAAVDLLGSLYIGVALPDFATQGDMVTVPWVLPATGAVGDAAQNPANGHCIPAVGYDAHNLFVVTWGALKSMSWEFYTAYADEAFAVMSEDFIGPGGKTPGGLDVTALREDLHQL